MRREIVSFAKLPLNVIARTLGHAEKQTFREYVAQTAVAGLRSEPVNDWLSLHRRLAEDGLYLSQMDGKFLVMDGWDRNREGVQLDSFGPSPCAEKLMKKWVTTRQYQRHFQPVEAPGRYNPDFIAADVRPEKSLKQKVCSSMPVVILENVCRKWHGKDGWKTAGLFTAHWLKRDYGCVFSMVTGICDGYDHNQTPVRADSVWSLLTLDNVNQLDGGWQPVPTDIFRRYANRTLPWSSYGELSCDR